MKKAVVLLSGGLDSATALYVARRDGYQITALSFFYGQKHHRELDFARALAAGLGIPHFTGEVPMPWKGSALLDAATAIPQNRSHAEMGTGIPATYVPARNSVFLALAASCAEATGAGHIVIGANVLDYSGYPDCRPEYFRAFEEMLRKGTKAGAEGMALKIEAPLLQLTKKEIILLANRLGVPLEKTWSCYQGGAQPCGTCDSCILRAKGFEEAGLSDPLIHYAASAER